MNIDLKNLPNIIIGKVRPLWRYRAVAFVLLVAGLCGYLVVHINQAVNTPAAASVGASSKSLHVDPKLARQLQQLQDNSVSVKALFNQARDNPFQ